MQCSPLSLSRSSSLDQDCQPRHRKITGSNVVLPLTATTATNAAPQPHVALLALHAVEVACTAAAMKTKFCASILFPQP